MFASPASAQPIDPGLGAGVTAGVGSLGVGLGGLGAGFQAELGRAFLDGLE